MPIEMFYISWFLRWNYKPTQSQVFILLLLLYFHGGLMLGIRLPIYQQLKLNNASYSDLSFLSMPSWFASIRF
jgi:hypothetical protein